MTAAVAAAEARDTTRLEHLLCFFVFVLFLYYFTNVILLGPLNTIKWRWQQQQHQQQRPRRKMSRAADMVFNF